MGLKARLWAALMKRARRWLMLSRVHVREMQSEAVPTELENGVSIRSATREDLIRAAREMPKQLDLEFVEDALARGDICLAAFHDETMVAFIWRSFTRVPHADGLWVEVEWPYRYGYKAYTKPEFRGQGLSGWLARLGDAVCLGKGFKYGVGFVETHNYPSIKADLRVGGRKVGYAGYLKLFGKAYPFRTLGVVPHTFRFYHPTD